ncbi:MAG: ParA family protein, partial [Gammaproteobacteria bacterium]|nr:ParA family protein [Gammaproteobacteria bacterium]
MKIWAIANQKGGVGKTTTAVTVAGILANRRYRPLLVDLDPHGSMTSYFRLDPDSQEDSVYQIFSKGDGQHRVPLASLLYKTEFKDLTLLPASTALATLDRQLAGRGGMGLVLAKTLNQCRHQFTHVLIDCPPIMGVLMVNALAACERLIIPVQTEFLALKGLERMLHTLSMILQARKTPLEYVIVPTLYDRRTRASKDTVKVLQERYPQHLWRGLIPVDTRFREASRTGQPLSLLSPSARGSRAYRKLLDFLLAK